MKGFLREYIERTIENNGRNIVDKVKIFKTSPFGNTI